MKTRQLVLLVLIALLVSPFASPAAAETHATFTVTANSDMVDFLPGDGVCETSAGNGMCTLRAAIMEANVHIGEDIISLPAATYALTIPGANEDLGATGDLDITDSLTITGLGYNDTIIDAVDLGDRVLDIFLNAAEVNISGIKIQKGSVAGDGGGIRANAALTLSDVFLLMNQATNWGGAIFSTRLLNLTNVIFQENSSGSLGGGIVTSYEVVAEDSRFTSNTTDLWGGAIYASPTANLHLVNINFSLNTAGENGGSIYTLADLEMEGSMVSEGDASNAGGGIFIAGDAKATLTNVSIIGNHAVMVGGGVWIAENGTFTGENLLFDLNLTEHYGGAINNQGAVHLYRSVLRENSADHGGAILTSTGSVTTIEESTIISNTATATGGGIGSNGTMTLIGVTLSANHAQSGGGVYNNGSLLIENCTISGNRSTADGGGVYDFGGVQTSIHNSTITANLAGSTMQLPSGVGGGVYAADMHVYFRNTILSGNHHRQLLNLIDDDCHGTLQSGDYNLVGTLSNCSLQNQPGHDQIGVDPLLGELADNGGPTQTYALLVGSPAIDGGDPEGCLGIEDAPLTSDQRGVTRPLDGDGDSTAYCDIGAYELSRYTYVYLPITVK